MYRISNLFEKNLTAFFSFSFLFSRTELFLSLLLPVPAGPLLIPIFDMGLGTFFLASNAVALNLY